MVQIIKTNKRSRSLEKFDNYIELFEDATAITSAPTTAEDGEPIPQEWDVIDFSLDGASSVTATAVVLIWGYKKAPGKWYPLAFLNDGDAIPEFAAGDFMYSEPFSNLYAYDRIAAQITAVTGTLTDLTLIGTKGVPARR